MAIVVSPTDPSARTLGHPDHDRCYRAALSRDSRFDGWFVAAVHTTGIYCRPSCPAITPKPKNVSFFPTAAAAQQRGFRACKRCRPDASPGSPEWNVRADVVARAMRLVADGVVDREGVRGLSQRLGYSERHLNRVMTDELGAGPLAVARAQRAQTARVLIETTSMQMTDVAFAAGFASVRQFNDTVREVFATSPTELRGSRRATPATNDDPRAPGSPGTITLTLPTRAPVELDALFSFIGMRTIRGVEAWDGTTYRRTLRLPRGSGVVALRPLAGAVSCALTLSTLADLQTAVQRCRRLLDLDADPVAIDAHLAGGSGVGGSPGSDDVLAPLVRKRPGLRSPGAVDGAEMLVRAILGQQVSVAGAATVAARLAADVGERVGVDSGIDPGSGDAQAPPTLLFPSPAGLLALDPDTLPFPRSRRVALRAACEALVDERLTIDPGADRAELDAELRRLPGIGPWTASYVAMRALGDPDLFLPADLGVRHALEALGVAGDPHSAAARADAWRPWRSYALHHLWATL
jgi:AraC family transcriptional regulator of adaptative response / DNA-3-methyladenine glycosylase II